ncbi:DUF1496 domain-containing protein [Pseudoalteromonas sp. SR44-5]|uniref:DUF1496 domain-containing protein n=1 Tax=Pseudoalteromonas TaxID=53246 RepID=UPI0016033E1A|nr:MULTISPECIES: DUF1496 domain-containing protein [unclassified Pseudoalteromonas]MBB1331945.1 DUF1496 domain-containing protein [Pseudoalteromonas sp. SR41-6]MBB1340828.1 DUF1496 domain-containing protein [Pseudoalteromonas sp. SR45-6]MBB1365741.1 DUF1496 domain-containing protein [Pseudoalteromonas sp. SR44-5]MBB1416798.1 DUF1496 domain-containing protein [Pseudoalteromonas sp. SG44-1]MBB1420536.1 DUF1496 domain-containing protein [Pseudoalteromonas sp. SG43-7]
MRIITIIGICFISVIYSANSFSNNQKPALFLDAKNKVSEQQLCWFEDQRYSEGAIILMANVRVICAAKNPHHNNSALNWLMLNEQNEIIYPTAPKTIRVN